MQNSENVLYNLSKQAKDEHFIFDRLYRNLYNVNFYYKAYANIYANDGSATKGVTNETADGFGDERINQIIESLRDESYQPNPARRTYIPKKDGNKRPLGIPTFTDRIVQEICRMLLEAIYEPGFLECSHGFRPERSCHTALVQIKQTFTGVNWFIEGDIKGFFDNIDHHTLINVLRKRIKDDKFIRLIWKFLKAGYIEDWRFHKTYSGTPQGGIASPILANIYLNEFDKFVINTLKSEFEVGKPKSRKRNTEYRTNEARVRILGKKIDLETDPLKREEMIKARKEIRKQMLNLPYYEPKNEGYKSLSYVRYADDFILGIHGSKEDCESLKEKMSIFLNDNLKLELSEEKTLITNSKNRARFLSYDIEVNRKHDAKRDKNGKTRRGYHGKVSFFVPPGTIEKVIMNHKMVKDINAKEWKILHRPSLLKLTPLEIVESYNSELRGLYNYYCLALNVSHKMWQLRYVMEYSCLKTLAGKFRISIGKIKEKYRDGKHWGIPYETKKAKKIAYFYKEPLTVKESAGKADVDVIPNWHKYQNTSEMEKRLKAKECELCGQNDPTLKYEVHHVNKMKNLKGKERWEVVMIGKQRKTLIVCQECHINIHKG
ncbi:group II intron reverse transcriptase/maturase [Bacillaceae bacterium Marseille-Q3522]|nr:group II intron reverse transcriptase/maturase [Bacillaceae bacterium Marseille-Q3522]